VVLNEIHTFLKLCDSALKHWDRYKGWRSSKKNPPAESVPSRFVRLFENHGVHRNQIPRYFGHGLTLQDVKDDPSLLPKLDEGVLDAACRHFAVRREWLDGAESQVHAYHDFYKHPEDFAALIKTLKQNNPDGELGGLLIAPVEKGHGAEALLILHESIGFVGEKRIYRYHLCNGWPFTYWKARAYLTACVAIAWRHSVFVHGTYSPMKLISSLAHGETLLGWHGEGVWNLGAGRWYPEDMALRPDVFLDCIDPEEDDYGIKSGLRLWLHLDQQGSMKTGLDKSVRQLFEDELAKHPCEPQPLLS
jgi:hypothetical protein